MAWFGDRYTTAKSIRSYISESGRFGNIRAKRKCVPIAVIDDNRLDAAQNLQRYDYDIQEIGDLKNLEEIEGFSIILCDVMGVGGHFGSKYEGAAIISEIKKNYPSKIVIAYTGGSVNSESVRKAIELSDEWVKKDVDSTEWEEVLDRYVEESIDPYEVWMRLRFALVEMELDTLDILRLEDKYVKSIQKRDKGFSDLLSTVNAGSYSGDVRAIVQNLIASTIFGSILGV